MSKKIARLLKADIQETSDLKSIAKMLAGKGRGGDTILAHITPKEVSLLKEAGGAGTINPETGLMEFYDDYSYYDSMDRTVFETPSYQIPQQYSYGSDYGDIQTFEAPREAEKAAPVSPFTVDYNAPAQQLTPSDIDPYFYQMQQQYGDMADIPSGSADEAMRNPADAYMAGQALYGRRPGEAEFMKQRGEGPVGTAPSALQKYVTDPLKAFKDATGLTGSDILRIGGAGAGALLGRQQSKEAAKQIQQATQEQKNLGAPYQKTGQELQRAAMSGELTPQGQQSLQAARAQLMQGIESRGGVGVAQAQAQIEALRQNLLQNQYNLGLQVAQIGDNIALGAIRTGMQLDQQLAQANQQFYTQLAQIAGGGTYGYNPQQYRG